MEIRKIQNVDRIKLLQMMHKFYASNALLHKANDDTLLRNIDMSLQENPYLSCYCLMEKKRLIGYFMLAQSFSTEYGVNCVWIEDLYIEPKFRGKGYGTQCIDYIKSLYKEYYVRFRLEVEEHNVKAIDVYEKNGFHKIDYLQMSIDPQD